MSEYAWTYLSETQPAELVAHVLPAAAVRGREDQESPLAVPGIGDRAVNALCGLGKAVASGRGYAVLAQAAIAAAYEPAVGRQTSYRGANQAFGEAKGLCQGDQAA
jgi:hypothetical protein